MTHHHPSSRPLPPSSGAISRTDRWWLALVGSIGLVLASCSDAEETEKSSGYRVSVKDFGAHGDGAADDASAVQRAIDSVPPEGGTVFVPPGTYQIGTELVINRNGLTLTGSGVESIFRLMDGATNTMIAMPARFGGDTSNIVVRDVTISRLTLDGKRNGHPQEGPSFFGVQILHAERVVLEELHVKDWPRDGISVGVGEKPNRDIEITRSHFSGIGRNAIHLGYGSNLLVDQVWVEDTPSQQWGPAAGNAVDVEVEGLDSFVDGFVIRDSLLERTHTLTAGDGIALQPAYGPLRNGEISRNIIRNHQMSVAVLFSDQNLVIDGNWIVSDDNIVSGHGIAVFQSSVVVKNNVINLMRWPSGYGETGINLIEAKDVRIEGNSFWGGNCSIRAVMGTGLLSIDQGNKWGNVAGCFGGGDAGGAVHGDSEGERVAVESIDTTPPAVQSALKDDEVISKSRKVNFTVSDDGTGVARVLFFIDGIPSGFRDADPYEVSVDPDRFVAGPHRIEAVAVDRAANLSARVGTTTVFRPTHEGSR